MSFFEVRDLSAGYGDREIIDGLSFSVEPHTVLGLLGANGCGKTTLLKAICGILPSKGNLSLSGSDLKKLSPKKLAKLCHYIPQKSGISITLSALDVVLMGFNPHLALLQYPTAEMKQKAAEALYKVGLGEKADADFQMLSEGQKQLCLLARALASDCRMLILDEPESALDFGGRYRMFDLLRDWVKADDRSAVVALHDPQLALGGCDALLLMKNEKESVLLFPKKDPLEKTEQALREIYGPLSIRTFPNQNGEDQLVLIREDKR